jgi:hypothetical protein
MEEAGIAMSAFEMSGGRISFSTGRTEFLFIQDTHT